MVYSKLGCQICLRTSVKTNNTRRRFWKITNTNHPLLKPDVNARTVALGEISYSEGRHVKKNRRKLKGHHTVNIKNADLTYPLSPPQRPNRLKKCKNIIFWIILTCLFSNRASTYQPPTSALSSNYLTVGQTLRYSNVYNEV